MATIARQSRRLFLRGVGGALVAAPFLGSVAERIAKAAGEPVPTPRRLIIMFTHYGCLTDRWFPENSHGELSAEDFEGTSLEPLAPHASKILLPRGIRAMNEWTLDASLGQGNEPLLQTAGSYLTCAPVTPHEADPLNPSGSRFDPKPIAASLDHVCAQQLSSDGMPLVLRLGNTQETEMTAISYSAPEELYPGIGNPAQVMSAFGYVPADGYETRRMQSVLDLVKGDLETLERVDMSASDKHKLAAWKELLHETSNVVSAKCSPELLALLGLTEQSLAVLDTSFEDRLATKITDSMDGADLFSNLAVLTALCDPSRVVVLKYPGNHVFRALGLEQDNRNIASRVGSAAIGGRCLSGVNDMILTIDRYYAEKFAHLVRQLDLIAEGDGTVLDNTAAVWFQQWSDGAAMNMNNMPIVQAGSCGGYFKTGWAVNVDGGTPDLHRGNSSKACETGVFEIDDFKAVGTPLEFGNAPINKYYCNLMNAIGVKAGADGFPAIGGTEAVTHYGVYDDTRDFASGGENPPRINDPGEFAELRANS
jgi:hypothetical protein